MLALFKNLCPDQVRNAVIFYSFVFFFLKSVNFFDFKETNRRDERIEKYGLTFSIFIYISKLVGLLTLPLNIQMLLYSLYYRQKKLPRVPTSLPKDCICFRIVTRGDYPEMVKENVDCILNLMKKIEFTNYLVEVVANKAINYGPDHEKVREIVVPDAYVTKNGSKFKARYKTVCNNNIENKNLRYSLIFKFGE
jgi:hypothetical protein